MNHQLRFAIGNLKRSSLTTVLNLAGLTSAFAAFILIMLYVWNERHFDCFNKNVNEIYRVEVKSPDKAKSSVFLLGPTGQTLVDEFPEIVASTTYMPWGKWNPNLFTWESGGKEIKSYEDYSYSDEKLTDIFSFNFINGKQNQPLLDPNSAIVSESFARKAWGSTDVAGKILSSEGNSYTVSAVFADFPENSVIQSPVIMRLPSTSWLAEAAKGWDVTNYPQFILVKPGTNPELLSGKINSQSIVRSKYSFYKKGPEMARLVSRPLRSLRFNSETAETPMFSSNSRLFVDSLFWVGILIIVVALINYINFATANIPRRIKSLSISRILGSSKLSMLRIFFSETLILFLVSFLFALSLAWLVNNAFSAQVLGYRLPFFEYKGLLAFSGLVFMALAGVSAIYPSVYSLKVGVSEGLKNFKAKQKLNFRGILSVSQFAATIALIALSTLVIKQVLYMERTDLGFNKSNTLVIPVYDDLSKNLQQFKDELKNCPYVSEAACSRAVPGVAQEMNTFDVEGKSCSIWSWAIDDNYMEMMGFKIVEGRNFLKDSEAETENVICNEAAARKFGWKLNTKVGSGYIVGIMKDFNYISLREQVEPFMFWYSHDPNRFQAVSLKLTDAGNEEALAAVGKIFTTLVPKLPFKYYFLDDQLNLLYSKENQQAKLITAFSLLSVVVSVLGILGLSIFMCQYKIKEIGIRKVNGAKISEVLAMLNRDFVKWVAVAFVIATPIAYYAMNKWLESFAYKTELSWWIFAMAGVMALVIALLTVSWQSWKAATRNPVEALRYE